MLTLSMKVVKCRRGRLADVRRCVSRQREVSMSPARRPHGPPLRKRTVRQVPINATFQTDRGATISLVTANKGRGFDPHTLLATIGDGRKFVVFPKRQAIFTQGDAADAVFYIQTGKVKLTVVSKTGKEAMIGILGEG